jgi:peptidyl-prolyl cis-trans isomerase D
MLQIMRRGQRWILWLVIFVVGGAFVFFLGSGGGMGSGSGPQVAVRVGERQFDFRDLDRVRQAQIAEYRRALGDAFDPEAAGDYLDQLAAGSLVQLAILAGEGERLGLRIGPREIREYLRTVPGGLDDQGRLNREVWTDHAEREYGSVARFEAALRDELLARKAGRLLSESITLSDAEVRDVLRYRLEEVRIAYVAISPDGLRPAGEIDDAAVEALLASDLPRVQTAYDDRKAEFDQPEQVRARHILIRVAAAEGEEAAAAEAAARQKAERAAARIRAGEPFEKVAEELSEDPGSKASGGDLGFFARGRMVPAFDEAAFSLEPGTLSEPVRSPYGFHVLRVEEKRPAKVVSFEEAKASLARELLRAEQGRKAAEELVGKLLEAIRGGRSLVDAARERGLAIERPEPLRRRGDGVIPGLGTSKEALAAVFSLTEQRRVAERAFEVGGKQVLFERLGGTTLADAELEPRLAATREQLLEEQRRQLQAAWVEARRKQLEASGELVYNLRPQRAQE